MKRLELNGSWKMRRVNTDQWLNVSVPGSVFNDLLSNNLIEDPFYRDNEDQAAEIASHDYEYTRDFDIPKNYLKRDKVLLCCEGLDTITEIKINGAVVANTDNMHRRYEFDVKALLKEGSNTISITLFSPIQYIRPRQEQNPTWISSYNMPGFQHIRKSHCMFGWDWGPVIPDSGIWRDIYIVGYDTARIDDVRIIQHHNNGAADIDIVVNHSLVNEECANCSQKSFEIEVAVISPDGEIIQKSIVSKAFENRTSFSFNDPKLWWPNGYGSQPLYKVSVLLKYENDIIDKKDLRIGLREIKVIREKDSWGESFEINVNGVSIFAMGADYIPEDSLLSRFNPERTERLIKDCIAANFNCIRVWGGGHYPWDYFYDLCDQYGLIVWQDLMFACAVYDFNDDFYENVKQEAIDNLRRIRHHACLGILCGNNEIEMAWTDWHLPENHKLKADYIKQFEVLLPTVAKTVAPDIFYWPSSPSSGGNFDKPNDFNRGDTHYWDVWHGQKPFTDYRKHYFRFASEFGFQSFPSVKTIEAFTLPEDRNIFSEVMEKHQKNGTANGKILYYISENFKYPKDFDSLVYTSQILQAEAIKYGVEHWRRNRGRCMGAIYWQLNDCWPVASWSSIDYYGRWKPLHYYARKFFAPVLLSACEEGTKIRLNISNESMANAKGTIHWKLVKNLAGTICEGNFDVDVQGLSATDYPELDFSDKLASKEDRNNTYFEYKLMRDGKEITNGVILFVKAKHFNFINPQLKIDIADCEDRYVIDIYAKELGKYIWLDLKDNDCLFSDNCFDLARDSKKRVAVMKASLSFDGGLSQFINSLTIKSVYDIS